MKKFFFVKSSFIVAVLLAFAPCSGQTSFYNSVKKEVDQRFAEIDAKIAENKAKNPDYSEYYKNLPVKVEQVSDFSVPDVEWNIAEKYPKIDRSGKKLCTKIIQKAIDDLSKKGGGRLTFPEGIYQTGPITLKSNIDFHLEKGALIQSTWDKTQFNKKHLIQANNVENLIISGEGVIDGNGLYWRPQKFSSLEIYKGESEANKIWEKYKSEGWFEDSKRKVLYPWTNSSKYPDLYKQSLYKNETEGYKKQGLERSYIFSLNGCKNLKITGVTFQNSPHMTVFLREVDNMIVDGITINSDPWTANTDALDFGRGNRMLIVNCDITSGDDGIIVKGGTASGNPSLTQNVLVRYNRTRYSHCGFGGGSEIVGGMKNIVVIDNAFDNSTTGGFVIKNPAGRGGEQREIYFYDNVLRNNINYGKFIAFNELYEGVGIDTIATAGDDKSKYFPNIHDVHFKNIIGYADGKKVYGIDFAGLKDHEIHDIDFENCKLAFGKKISIDFAKNITFKNCAFESSESGKKISNSSDINFVDTTINGAISGNEIIWDFSENTYNLNAKNFTSQKNLLLATENQKENSLSVEGDLRFDKSIRADKKGMTVSNPSGAAAVFTLKLASPATVSFELKGSSSTPDDKNFMVLQNSSNEVLISETKLPNKSSVTIKKALEAGTYKFYLNGGKLLSIMLQ